MDKELATPVTTVIHHRPLASAIGKYEDWLKEIALVAQQFEGHQGVNVIRPHSAADTYTIVVHFDTVERLRKWLDSDARRQLVGKIRPFLRSEEHVDIKTGLEFWFTPPPRGKQAKPYKQFLVTFSAILPLTILVPWLLQPLFAGYPTLALPLVRQCIVAAVIVGLMTYVVMPHYIRLVARWLFR